MVANYSNDDNKYSAVDNKNTDNSNTHNSKADANR